MLINENIRTFKTGVTFVILEKFLGFFFCHSVDNQIESLDKPNYRQNYFGSILTMLGCVSYLLFTFHLFSKNSRLTSGRVYTMRP